jgi:small conductance mechanosensitive channel
MIRFWTDVVNQSYIYEAQHAVLLAIKEAYNQQNINIPFQMRTLDFGKNKFRSEPLDLGDTRN